MQGAASRAFAIDEPTSLVPAVACARSLIAAPNGIFSREGIAKGASALWRKSHCDRKGRAGAIGQVELVTHGD